MPVIAAPGSTIPWQSSDPSGPGYDPSFGTQVTNPTAQIQPAGGDVYAPPGGGGAGESVIQGGERGTTVGTPSIGYQPIIRGEPTSPALQTLYPAGVPPTEAAEAAPAVQATGAQTLFADAAQVAGTPGATAQQAQAGQVVGGPTEMSAAQQMADITAQDSPLMRQARQQGLQTAARRGLLGSIGASTSDPDGAGGSGSLISACARSTTSRNLHT